MKALILAAGRGERMRPLTDVVPKPLLSAGGRPLIVWHLQRLADAGIRDVVVNHAWLGDRIQARLGDGAAFGLKIRYSAEAVALETAGGIRQAMPLLRSSARRPVAAPEGRDEPSAPQPFLVISGDTFCDFDYGRARTIALQMQHARLSCWCVMVPNPAHHPAGDFRLVGGLLADPDHPQAASEESDEESGDESGGRSVGARGHGMIAHRLTYSGIGLYTPGMFDDLAPGEKSPLRPWLAREIAAGRAAGEYHGGLWFDIGTAQRLAELDRLLDARPNTIGV